MTITPFLTLSLRGKKDALHARRQARRVATLLGFTAREQACIAAGVFVIACQALTLFGKTRLCFQIETQQLHVFAQGLPTESVAAASTASNRITERIRTNDPRSLYRLSKPLPAVRAKELAECDLGWLIAKVEETAPSGLFDEIVKQNQEILMLLSELRLCQTNMSPQEEKSANPHAA